MNYITVGTQFIAGTKARASQVNANFASITDNLSDGEGDIYIGAMQKMSAITNATMAISDSGTSVFLINNTTTAATVTLPTLADNLNRLITIKKIGETKQAGLVNIDGENAETIDGETDIDLLNQYDYITLIGGASEWHVLDKNFSDNDLNTKHLLNNSDLPSINNVDGWHGFSGVYANAAAISGWIGSNDLKAISVNGITTTTNHLGNDSALDLDGTNDAVYANTTTYDTINENFTIHGWYKLDRANTNEYMVSKYISDNTGNSFYVRHNTDEEINYAVYVDNAGDAKSLTVYDFGLTNGAFHHYAFRYQSDTANSNIGLWVDGYCRAYKVDADLATRNNTSTSKLTFGGYGNGTAISPLQGQIDDFLYAQTAMSSNEIRKAFIAGCNKNCTQDSNDKIIINDGRCLTGWYREQPGDNTNITTTVDLFPLYLPEDNYYKLYYNFRVKCQDDGGDQDAQGQFTLYNSTISKSLTSAKVIGHEDVTGLNTLNLCHFETEPIFLNKNDKIVIKVDSHTDVVQCRDADVWWEKQD